jgi:hypothetical protein
LDGLLGLFPPGALSEIVGPWSSGSSSLLWALVARVTTSGGRAALVDGGDAFDPESAREAGADLSRVLWVRGGGRLRSAWGAADLLARCPGFALIAFDLGDPPPGERLRVSPAAPRRLQRAVEGTPAMLVLRTPERLAGSAAALVVSLKRLGARWVGAPRPTRLAGFDSEALVLRSRAHHPDQRWIIGWRFPGASAVCS